MIKNCVVILSAIFTTALNDQVTFIHPCKGVKTPPVPKKIRKIVTPEQFEILYQALPDNEMRLLVETDVETGLRWGELIELRVRDLDLPGRVLTVSRVAVEVTKTFRVEVGGQRFLVKEYPKDKEHRRLRLSRQIAAKIDAHISSNGLGPDDLLFAIRNPNAPNRATLRAVPDPDALGLTEPNAAGRQYRHGTMTAYGMAQPRSTGLIREGRCLDARLMWRLVAWVDPPISVRRPALSAGWVRGGVVGADRRVCRVWTVRRVGRGQR